MFFGSMLLPGLTCFLVSLFVFQFLSNVSCSVFVTIPTNLAGGTYWMMVVCHVQHSATLVALSRGVGRIHGHHPPTIRLNHIGDTFNDESTHPPPMLHSIFNVGEIFHSDEGVTVFPGHVRYFLPNENGKLFTPIREGFTVYLHLTDTPFTA